MRPIRLDELAAGPVLPPDVFSTPWQDLDLLRLDPDAELTATDASQLCWIVLEGTAALSDPAAAALKVRGPAAVVPAPGAVLRNAAPTPLVLLAAAVDLQGTTAVARSRADAVDADRLVWRDAIHGGAGRIATRHIWGPDDFASAWTFIDHAVLAADSSVGLHYHDALEECFIVLAGEGLMTVDGVTFAVGPGDVTWQGIGRDHGIYNPGPRPLDFLRLAVSQPGETYTTIDRHDDLRRRRP